MGRIAALAGMAAALLANAPQGASAQAREDGVRTQPAEYQDAAAPVPFIELEYDYVFDAAYPPLRPYFFTDSAAYVLVFAITDEGVLSVVHPSRPTDLRAWPEGRQVSRNYPFYSAPRNYRINYPSGRGILVAVASFERFDLSAFTAGRSWNADRFDTFTGHQRPFDLLDTFIEAVLPEGAEFAVDYKRYDLNIPRNERRAGAYTGLRYNAGDFGYSSRSFYDSCHRFPTRTCRAFNRRYGAPVIFRPAGRSPYPGRTSPPRPREGDPVGPRAPVEPKTRARLPHRNPGEHAHRRTPAGEGPRRSEPRTEARRSEPRAETRRSEPRTEARRSEPRIERRQAPERERAN